MHCRSCFLLISRSQNLTSTVDVGGEYLTKCIGNKNICSSVYLECNIEQILTPSRDCYGCEYMWSDKADRARYVAAAGAID